LLQRKTLTRPNYCHISTKSVADRGRACNSAGLADTFFSAQQLRDGGVLHRTGLDLKFLGYSKPLSRALHLRSPTDQRQIAATRPNIADETPNALPGAVLHGRLQASWSIFRKINKGTVSGAS